MNNEIKTHFLFEKVNYKILLIGLGVIALGFILMAGGGSDDPKVFSDAIFNFQRIRLAPTVVLIGFGITIYAILKNPAGTPVAVIKEDAKAGQPASSNDRLVEEQPIKNFTNKKKK
ncbi:hypothetical protein HYN59_02630 [Flavobacterium album]|uniref:DUF3098 domain-containing protein n=1 Tax=Flavobacterium album TaxID=2175091 RepID=A0A2S1QUM0_9FLAO|nr:hypothetical protein HYN59_02630 [Flavobacterium album]